MPRAKPAALHGPHHATYVEPLTPIAVIEWPAPVSWTIFQSHAVALQVVFQPLPWLSQTNSPPATQWAGFAASGSNGAMKRAFGSHGLGVYVKAKHDGLISRYAGSPAPVDLPPFVVSAISRSTYSLTAWSPFVWSTMLSPPSPPNGETISVAPGLSSETPLSCRPPQIASPPATGPASA